jgi:hypothetical protein
MYYAQPDDKSVKLQYVQYAKHMAKKANYFTKCAYEINRAALYIYFSVLLHNDGFCNGCIAKRI